MAERNRRGKATTAAPSDVNFRKSRREIGLKAFLLLPDKHETRNYSPRNAE